MSKSQDDLINFVNDPETIKRAAEGSMEKRQATIDNTSAERLRRRVELEANTWWITTGIKQGGKKLLGPFATEDLALSVRTYMEIAEAPATYWVEQLKELDQPKGKE
jgi:hypothetical protein